MRTMKKRRVFARKQIGSTKRTEKNLPLLRSRMRFVGFGCMAAAVCLAILFVARLGRIDQRLYDLAHNTPQPEPEPVPETPVDEPEPEQSNSSALLLVVAVVLAGCGAVWYFKFCQCSSISNQCSFFIINIV